MPPIRLSFLGRFCLSLCVFAAFAFCLYVIEALLFYAPVPSVPAYNIAPQWAQAQAAQRQIAAETQAPAGQSQMAALMPTPGAEPAAAVNPTALAAAQAGGIKEGDAVQPFFAAADKRRGRRIFARCAACHTANAGGGNRLGPALWGINGRPVASAPGFSYSTALKNFAQKQKNWDLAALDRFLYAPAKTVPGTIMFYPGVKDLQERADLLLYLQSLK
ncbi:MAG: hypothetical protein DU429_02045 [Candidatus Tokpelaia sp.]|uniref:c-type cytochrome n=1 Tax=Candidatus Tokpelaia sp. TaxID=2233777 RepID=UPI00123BF669|nr:c-type cytochrome [Candidatus Tokpelaia sp.]KAA6205669.1 MAG: hypothetical protein DU430_03760 [Candidatus Tokpelaia sp.]KAA6207285.1 MAG: hypothetical protein DU429_02045 [Candidatus Tokpelaia sp.]KAA6405194.1 hypothetical protein DPQ22_06595 [Candidatus Tokpelaia sp.]